MRHYLLLTLWYLGIIPKQWYAPEGIHLVNMGLPPSLLTAQSWCTYSLTSWGCSSALCRFLFEDLRSLAQPPYHILKPSEIPFRKSGTSCWLRCCWKCLCQLFGTSGVLILPADERIIGYGDIPVNYFIHWGSHSSHDVAMCRTFTVQALVSDTSIIQWEYAT